MYEKLQNSAVLLFWTPPNLPSGSVPGHNFHFQITIFKIKKISKIVNNHFQYWYYFESIKWLWSD